MTCLKPDLRERVFVRGLDYPNDEELLMLILGSGTKECPIEILAEKIKSIVDVTDRENLVNKLLEVSGVGLGKALSVAAAVEFGRRRAQILKARIKQPRDLLPYIQHYAFKSSEHFLTIGISGAAEIINCKVTAIGNANSAAISPREVFFDAVKMKASAIVLAHNHPSGACEPSDFDIVTTRHIISAGQILGIQVLDHIILARTNYFSFKEHRLLQAENDL